MLKMIIITLVCISGSEHRAWSMVAIQWLCGEWTCENVWEVPSAKEFKSYSPAFYQKLVSRSNQHVLFLLYPLHEARPLTTRFGWACLTASSDTSHLWPCTERQPQVPSQETVTSPAAGHVAADSSHQSPSPGISSTEGNFPFDSFRALFWENEMMVNNYPREPNSGWGWPSRHGSQGITDFCFQAYGE